jgi:nitrite reductase/ring-hydroxylating ferredoxin subunit
VGCKQIALPNELTEGKTLKFQFTRGDQQVDGFVARFHGQIIAHENPCRHLPLTLDYDDSQFFSRDGKHFTCQTHGAIYDPVTGICVRGPCQGESLKAPKIEVRGGAVAWRKNRDCVSSSSSC